MDEKEILERQLKASVFKIELEKISLTALEASGVHSNFTDMQLSDAMLVFIEVFMNKMYDFHKDKLTQEQMEKLAEESGKSLRQTVLLFTGVDLHSVFK